MICDSCGLSTSTESTTTTTTTKYKQLTCSTVELISNVVDEHPDDFDFVPPPALRTVKRCPIKSCLKKRTSLLPPPSPSPPPSTINQSLSSSVSSSSSSSSRTPESILARCDETLAKLRLSFTDGLIDDYIVGDRVWVDGNKPGHIQFIGEVHFAEGDWAGIVLDEPIGKNAGSVGGRRYFYCEPKRGLFARLQRLSRYPYSFGKSTPDSGISADGDGIIARGLRRSLKTGTSGTSPRGTSRSPSRSYTSTSDRSRSLSRSISRSPESTNWLSYSESHHPHDPNCPSSRSSSRRAGSPMRHRSVSPLARYSWANTEDIPNLIADSDDYSVNRSTKVYSYTLPRKPASTFTTVSSVTTTVDGKYRPGPLTLGDKVFVNSTKGLLTGRLRFIGTTHFAPGQWAGVELDEPHGKNDGQVAGKRYFNCRSRYGLFSPVYKVVKADPNRMTTVTRTVRNGPRF